MPFYREGYHVMFAKATSRSNRTPTSFLPIIPENKILAENQVKI